MLALGGCRDRERALPPDAASPPDLAEWLPDLAEPDLAAPDLAESDLAAPADLLPLPDLARPDLVPGSDTDAFLVGDLGLGSTDLRSLSGNPLPLDGGAQPLATLVVQIVDGETLAPMPSALVFRPPPGGGFASGFGAPFDGDNLAARLGAVVGPGLLGFAEGVMLVDGTGELPVPAGTYHLVATRGPEYEQSHGVITVAAGERREVSFRLDRTVDTTGWLSADLHVHAAPSFDSELLRERRVISMVTSDIEIIVPTEHNIQIDLSPEIAALGYAGMVGHVTGNEFNFEPGHGGAFPTPFDPDAIDGGAFPWTPPSMCGQPGQGINCYIAEEAFAKMRGLIPGQTAVAINHAWWGGADLGYFTNIGWGAGTDQRTAVLPSAGTFDAIEVLNGYWPNLDVIGYLLEDWFTLLDDGYRVSAVGNSDSHSLAQNRVGYPRNWLRLPIDAPNAITPAMLGEAVRQGRVVASSGPFIDMRIDGAQIGDTVTLTGGSVDVTLVVDAPRWIAVDRVRVYLNGDVVKELPIANTSRPLLQTTFALSVPADKDGYILAIASGDTPLPADVVGGPNWRPIAIANPIYLDGNGDGMFRMHRRMQRRRLSGFDPRSVPTERVLDLPQHSHRPGDDAREAAAVAAMPSLHFDAWWAEELARWGGVQLRRGIDAAHLVRRAW